MADLTLSEKRVDEIRKALDEKGVISPCSRCESRSFTIFEGYSSAVLQDNQGKMHQRIFPMVVVICENCGCRFEHSVLTLGLKDEDEIQKELEIGNA